MDKPYERQAGQVHADQAAFAKACANAQQDKGDLRGTSQGERYPYAAVMYQHGDCIAWFVEHLQQGKVLCALGGWPIACGDEFVALGIMDSAAGLFKEGRPVFNTDTKRWVLQPPSNPVRVVRLHSMLHPNASQA